jgi:signal transduction histidine kinase
MASIDIQQSQNKQKLLAIVCMVIGISGLHLVVPHAFEKGHIVARELYFLPIILSGFWFGLRGAVITSLSITAFYLTYATFHWRGFTPGDLDRLLEIGLFNIVAITTGFLQDRQKARTREKLESIKALAGTVAHEMNSPLFVAMGNLELLQDDFDQDSEPYQEMDGIKNNLNELKILIQKISQLEDVVIKDYYGTSKIVDLDSVDVHSGTAPHFSKQTQGD